ncbi:MAG: metallophosphoesterase [Chloroflexi bacterium]|nr:metallophosphoesterase [Chloroflexota bacterium]
MKILAVSDIVLPFIYSPQIRARFQGVDLTLGCGDLPYYYQEYILTALNCPLFFVRGNHDHRTEETEGVRSQPGGGVDLHRRVVKVNNLWLAGVEGSLRYREGYYQYSQGEMWEHVLSLVPRLLWNQAAHGRALDIFVTHAPPEGLHDRSDLPHQGIRAFRWLDRVFQPRLHLHGHVHRYRPDEEGDSLLGKTRVVNAYGYQEIELGD